MEYKNGLANSRFDIVSFKRPYLDKLFDDVGDYYGKMGSRLKHVFPQHVAEIRTGDDGANQIYVSSAHQKAYDFSQGKVKKVNKWMNEHKGQFRIGYDFFKQLVLENSVEDIVLLDKPQYDDNTLFTKTTILRTWKSLDINKGANLQFSNVEPLPVPANSDNDEDSDSVVTEDLDNSDIDVDDDSDNNSNEGLGCNIEDDSDSDWTNKISNEANKDSTDNDSLQSNEEGNSSACAFRCNHCGRIFQSNYNLNCHTESGICKTLNHENNTIEARGLRMLKDKLDNNEIIIAMQGSDVSHIMPPPSCSWSTDYFNRGWAVRPKHGKTKGHAYITADHKDMIENFFEDGEKDKGMKMSAALMLEAMTSNLDMIHTDGHPHPKHYLPSISEITVVINQLSMSKKKRKVIKTRTN